MYYCSRHFSNRDCSTGCVSIRIVTKVTSIFTSMGKTSVNEAGNSKTEMLKEKQ